MAAAVSPVSVLVIKKDVFGRDSIVTLKHRKKQQVIKNSRVWEG